VRQSYAFLLSLTTLRPSQFLFSRGQFIEKPNKCNLGIEFSATNFVLLDYFPYLCAVAEACLGQKQPASSPMVNANAKRKTLVRKKFLSDKPTQNPKPKTQNPKPKT
jgi:hypothetical protein